MLSVSAMSINCFIDTAYNARAAFISPLSTRRFSSPNPRIPPTTNLDIVTGTHWDDVLQNPQYQENLLETFDENYYRQTNPDVNLAITQGTLSSGLQQYIYLGETEGRSPNQFFDESYYLNTNPDVANAVQAGVFNSGFEHFVMSGAEEGRNPSTQFNTGFYLAQNPDVLQAINSGVVSNAFSHYTLYGQFEGRVATSI